MYEVTNMNVVSKRIYFGLKYSQGISGIVKGI
jgi:hypothetical protein